MSKPMLLFSLPTSRRDLLGILFHKFLVELLESTDKFSSIGTQGSHSQMERPRFLAKTAACHRTDTGRI